MNRMLSRLDDLDNDLNRLLEELRDYSDGQLNRSPGENRWSALQVMNHLLLAEQLSLRSVKKRLQEPPVGIPSTNLLSGLRRIWLGWFLSLPISIKAPDIVGSDKLKDNSTFWTVAREYRQTRIALRELLETMPETYHHKQLYRHPLAGAMGIAGMIHFFDRHFIRHRRQILKTLRR